MFPRDKECLEIHKYLSAGTLNPGNCNELAHEGTQDVEHTHRHTHTRWAPWPVVISYSRGLLDYCERRRKLLLMVGTGQEWSWECDCLSNHGGEKLPRLLSLAASHSLGSLSVGHISADKRPDRGDCNHSVWVYEV